MSCTPGLCTHDGVFAQVVDDEGQQHEVLLRNCVHGQEGMYLLDRLGPVLQRARARGGDMLMLSRQQHGPVVSLTPSC